MVLNMALSTSPVENNRVQGCMHESMKSRTQHAHTHRSQSRRKNRIMYRKEVGAEGRKEEEEKILKRKERRETGVQGGTANKDKFLQG